jgi:hypothetical protein
MMHDKQSRLHEILRARGFLTPSAQKSIMAFMERWGVDLFRAAIEVHLIDESLLADIIASELKIPRLSRIRLMKVQSDILEKIPYDAALELLAFPFEMSSAGRLHVVISDPTDEGRCQRIQSLVGCEIERFVGDRSEIIGAIQRHYPMSMQVPHLLNLCRNAKDCSK